jgi:hypothetical protein
MRNVTKYSMISILGLALAGPAFANTNTDGAKAPVDASSGSGKDSGGEQAAAPKQPGENKQPVENKQAGTPGKEVKRELEEVLEKFEKQRERLLREREFAGETRLEEKLEREAKELEFLKRELTRLYNRKLREFEGGEFKDERAMKFAKEEFVEKIREEVRKIRETEKELKERREFAHRDEGFEHKKERGEANRSENMQAAMRKLIEDHKRGEFEEHASFEHQRNLARSNGGSSGEHEDLNRGSDRGNGGFSGGSQPSVNRDSGGHDSWEREEGRRGRH